MQITGSGYGLEGKISHAAGTTETIDAAILPYVIASDAKLVDGKVVGRPDRRARCSCWPTRPGSHIDATREQLPRLATLPFDPTYKLMATFNQAKDAAGRRRRALLRQGRGAGGDVAGVDRPVERHQRPVGRRAQASGPSKTSSAWARPVCG